MGLAMFFHLSERVFIRGNAFKVKSELGSKPAKYKGKNILGGRWKQMK